MMRILLADHHSQSLRELSRMIRDESGFDVVGEAVDGESLLDQAFIHKPALILMDSRLPGKPIKSLIITLHLIKPKPTILVMSSNPEDGRVALQAGADAFVSKGDPPDWLLQSLRKYRKPLHVKKEERSINSV